ncbi:uncharacterized protein C4orf50 homolog [Saccopteryx bilineata]|uniref:uncharacterized protein C4orf50 homolog n=1 Tax=Saccopteryx bilineata TaxID=59482 RepID=UPI00338F0AFE
MEPAAQGHSEKTFSYVVRAPGGDGSDVMNVDVKIDTSWVFQDAEDGGGEEPGCLLDGAASSSPDVDTGTLRRQLESSEQKLLAAVDKYVTSESGLRSRVQELELSERQLLRKVDQLSARVHRERNASLHAQEQLEALQGELASQVCKERAARRQRWRVRRLREQLRHKDEALGQQTAALERCRRNQRRELGLVREQERVLRAQVQRLERDVRRLCRAAGLLLAELDTPSPGSPRAPAPADSQDAPEEAAELRALQARAERGERERDEAARRLREQRATERRLRGQLEELQCCLYELQLSEIGLQGQVEDLAEQNRSLREELGAQVLGERVRSTAPAGHGSLGALGRGQDEWLRLSPEEALDTCQSQRWQTSVYPDGAPGPWASAESTVPTTCVPAQGSGGLLGGVVFTGDHMMTRSYSILTPSPVTARVPGQPAVGPCTWGSAGAGRGPPALVPGLETTAGFLRDLAGPDYAQPAPTEPSLHEQALLLVCGCPSGLLPTELAWMSGQRLPAALAQESFLLVQTSTLPPWGSAGDPTALLLPEASAEELYLQRGLDARPLPAPRAFGKPCGDRPQTRSCGPSLCQECPPLSHQRSPGTGPTDLNDPWKEGGGTPEWRPEDWGARRTWGRKEGDLGDRYQRREESHERLGLEDGAGALEGPQSQHRASEPRATASCPWPRQEPFLPLLQGAASVSMEGPKSLSSRRQVEEHVWGLLGRLPSVDEEWEPPGAEGPSPAGGQLLAEQDRATGRVRGEEERHMRAGHALLPLKENPGREGQGEEEAAVCLDGSSLGHSKVLGEPVCKEREAKETLFSVEKGGLPLPARLAVSPEEAKPTSPPRAPRQGPEASVLTIDAFAEGMEVCFRHLSTLELGSGGRRQEASALAGEDGSLAGRWPSDQGPADPRQVWADQGLHTRPAEEADPKESREGIKPGETEVPGHVLPGTGPDSEDLLPGPERPPERGQDLCQPSRALERARSLFHQLISALKKERSKVLHDNIRLQRDHTRCHHQLRVLQAERERHVARIAALERDNGVLLGDVSHLQGELAQYRQAVSDLEDCNGKSYGRISELETENESLKRRLGQLQRAKSQSARQFQGALEDTARENRELSALISELGVSYKELIKDVVLGIEDMIRALRGENAHLLRRVRVLEREVASGLSADAGRLGAAEERPRGKSKVDAVERAVQVTQPSEQLPAGAHEGPFLEQKEGPAAGGLGPSAGTERSRGGAGSAAPSPAGRGADGSSAPQGSPDGTGMKEARLGKEEERPGRSADRGPALRTLSNGPQLRDPEAESSEEDLRLRVRQLRHQVLTLQCQLRDQASAGRELQAARDEALRLRDQLKGKVDELQKKQHEANLAVTPLKAKLASLVQKCRDRNHLLTHLLQELCRHGVADHLLSEMVCGMVNDVALAEYAATFLAGVPESTQMEFPREALGSGWQPRSCPADSESTPGLVWEVQTQEGWWVLGAPDWVVRLAYLPAGISKIGQTCECALLAYTLGVRHLMFGVSKTISTEPPCGRKSYEEIVQEDVYKTGDIGTIPGAEGTLLFSHPAWCVCSGVKNVSVGDGHRGRVAGDSKNDPPSGAAGLTAQVIVPHHPGQVSAGRAPGLGFHVAHGACSSAERMEEMDRHSGKKLERGPKHLKYGDAAIVETVPEEPDPWSSNLTRTRLRCGGSSQQNLILRLKEPASGETDSEPKEKHSLEALTGQQLVLFNQPGPPGRPAVTIADPGGQLVYLAVQGTRPYPHLGSWVAVRGPESPLSCLSFQTGRCQDAEPEETAAGGAQKYLLLPELDGVFPRSLRSESWPLPEAEWPARTARLDSPELPLPSGPTPDPGRRPAVATVVSGAPAPCLQEKGGMCCPALRADGLPPPSGLTSPARILAFHRELRQSICGNSWVNKSPLEL